MFFRQAVFAMEAKLGHGISSHFLCARSHTRATTRSIDHYSAKLINLNFQPLEVVSRYSDPQPQVVENYSYMYLFNFRPNINRY